MLDPLPLSDWTPRLAAHLLNRAGFGGSPREIAAFHELGLEGALDQLLDPPPDPPAPVPTWGKPGSRLALRRELRNLPEEEQRRRMMEQRREDARHLGELRIEWLERMRSGNAPLREKLTLFWHGHFATSTEKVRAPYLIWQQLQTLRQHALGGFRELTRAISRDPAMLVYLDTVRSRRSAPNENFARELMELFTLGEGHYSEQDIREAARAFCGYGIDLATETFRLVHFQQDRGSKTFLGHTGPLDGDGVIDRLLEHPACAPFLARKLWVFFASENPPEPVIEALADELRRSDYALRPTLRKLFASREFYGPESVRRQIKSPVQWLVQTARVLECPFPAPVASLNALRQLGQVLFAPPSVKGWDGGRAWISTSTLLARYNLSNLFLSENPQRLLPSDRPALARLARRRTDPPVNLELVAPAEQRANPEALVEALAWRLYQDPPAERERVAFLDYLKGRPAPPDDDTVTGLLHLMMSTPQFQLC